MQWRSGSRIGRLAGDVSEGAPLGWSIVGIDPGTHTGVAWALVSVRQVKELGWKRALAACRSDQVRERWAMYEVAGSTEDRSVDQLLELLDRFRYFSSVASAGRISEISHIVTEDFILRERTMERSLLSPVRITEKLEYALHSSGSSSTLSRYSAADAKTIVTDERLKRWGLYDPKSKHARDALRQLIMKMRELSETIER
jgi:hypothetical protein